MTTITHILMLQHTAHDAQYAMEAFCNNHRSVLQEVNKRANTVLLKSGAKLYFLWDEVQLRGREFHVVIINERVSGPIAQLATTRVR